MTPPAKFSQLSSSKHTLIRIMQRLNYGSILNLKIAKGELSFDSQPDVLIDVRLDEEVGPRAELSLNDFELCAEMRRLFDQIDTLQNGTIEKIVVHGGIPRRVILRLPLCERHQRFSREK
jgi:hypothetical protein